MAGELFFHNAHASGTIISQLGSGTYDHLGFFGADYNTAIDVNSYQDSTYIVNSAGTPLGGDAGILMNVKYKSSTTCDVSGWTDVSIDALNVFDVDNLSTSPDFAHRPSGTLMIRYCASGVSTVNTYQAKLYAYDATGSATDPAPDVTVMGFEINASGLWYSGQSGVWVAMEGSANPLHFVDHSATNNYEAASEHIWVAAITVRADSVGILDDWNLAFTFQYA